MSGTLNAPRPLVARWSPELLLRRGALTPLETAVASAALLVLGIAAYASHIRGGGFYYDDWHNFAQTHYPPGGGGFGAAVDYFAGYTAYRPALILYVPLTHELLGGHMGWHLALATLLAVAMSAALYAVLRMLTLEPLHAGLIAALVLVFPWSDSTRLWATASMTHLAIAIYLLGLMLALRGVKRGSWRLHAAALTLYLLSMLTYELTAPLVALGGALYLTRGRFGEIRARWGLDAVAAIAVGIYVSSGTRNTKLSLADQWDHFEAIVRGGGTVLARSAWPVGPAATTLVLVLLAFVAGVGLSRPTARRWVVLMGAGLAVAAAGWVLFIPADPYYTPYLVGLANRVNVVAGIGLVMIAYGAFGVLASFLPAGRHAPALAAAGIALGAGYVTVLDRHIGTWNTAFKTEMAALLTLRGAVQDPPPGSTIYTFGAPGFQAPGVPIFAASWDLNGAVKMQFQDGTLSAYPVLPQARLECAPDAVRLVAAGFERAKRGVYGRAYLVDIPSGRVERPRDAQACARVVGQFAPGPFELTAEG